MLKITTAKKRIYGLLTAVVFTLTLLPLSGLFGNAEAAAGTETGYSFTGAGTQDDPYKITNEKDLQDMRTAVNSGAVVSNKYATAYYVLANDITLTEKAWSPIGKDPSYSLGNTANYHFKGTFDGQGHKITGLTISGDSRSYILGLFGMNQGTIKNLNVVGNIANGGFGAGMITAVNGENGTIENCCVSGDAMGMFSIGGIAGENSGTIKSCYSEVKGTAASASTFGYFVGTNKESGTVENCYYNVDFCTHSPKHTAFGGNKPDGDSVKALTADEIKEGIAAYELRNAQKGTLTAYWGQDLDKENVPKLSTDDKDRVYKVSYMLNGKEVAAAYANNGDTLTLPDVDYDNDGTTADSKWYKDEGQKQEWIFDTDKVSKDMNLYTGEALTEYTITLVLNGGKLTNAADWTVEGDKATMTYTVKSGDIKLPSPELADHEFLGWTYDGTAVADKNASVKAGSTGDKTFTAVYRDNVGPKITITLDGHTWNGLHTDNTFGMYFNKPQKVTVSAEDNKTEKPTVSYYISDKAMTEAGLKKLSGWKTYTAPIDIDVPEGNKIVYVKAVDGDGNESYASTAGLVFDITHPDILGIDNGQTYCTHIDITIDEKNLKTVTVDGETLFDSSKGDSTQKFTIENKDGKSKEVTVEATDKAGNTTTEKVTLTGQHIYKNPFNTRTEMITPNTCTIPGMGYLVKICDVCGEQTKEDYVGKATGHNWSEWKDIETGTCGGKTQQRTCSRCHIVETQSTNSTHTWSEEYTIDKQPSCIVQGQRSKHCTVCGAIDPESIEILEPLPHSVGRTLKQNEIPATCTEKGSYTNVTFCNDCGCEISRVIVTIDPVGHTWGAWEKVPWNNNPSSEKGEMQRKCSVCGAIESTEYHEEHQWEEDYTIDQSAKCVTPGSKSIHCANCGTTKPNSTVVIPATGHTTATKTTASKEATCTEGGYTTVLTYCTVCKDEISEITTRTAQKGHSFGAWEEILTQDGQSNQQRKCITCGYTEVKGTDLVNHKWKDTYDTDKEPTCEDEGSESIHCSVCGITKPDSSKTIPAKGHTWGEWETVDSPECEDSGTQERKCTVCKKKETRGLDPSGHTWEEDYTVDKPATCTEEGSESIHCEKCDAVLDSRTIPAKGHTPAAERKGVKEATATEEGYTGDIVCKVCGEVITYGTVIPVIKGELNVVPQSGKGAPALTLTDEDKAALENAVLTAEDKAALEDGAKIEIVISIEDATASVTADDKALTDKTIAGKFILGQYINIDIKKIIDGKEFDVTQLSSEISLTVAVPDSLKADGRTFAVVRLHDGKADILSDLDKDANTITFKTDKFSVYAIVYADKVPPAPSKPDSSLSDKSPATGEGDYSLVFMILASAVLGAVCVIRKENKSR